MALPAVYGIVLLALLSGSTALAEEADGAGEVAEAKTATTRTREIVPYEPRMRTGDEAAERETVMELLWPEHLGADTAAMIFGGVLVEAGGHYGGGTTTGGTAGTTQNTRRAPGTGQGGGYDQRMGRGEGYGQGHRMQQGATRLSNPTLNAFGTTYR